MKKILFALIIMSFAFPAHADEKMCTMEYAPVCAEVEVQCIKAPCPPIQETFSNTCMMENNSLAKFKHEGVCKQTVENEEPIICTMEYAPVCGIDGKTYGNACSAGKTAIKHQGECQISESGITPPKACTREYAPVCGQPKMPECKPGMMCIQVMPQPKEYGNKCMMEADGAELLYEGNCESNLIEPRPEAPVMCTMEYAPVCGVDGKTYGNACSAGKVEVKHNGACIAKMTQIKFTTAVDVLLEKYDSKFETKQEYKVFLEKLVKKINTLAKDETVPPRKQELYRVLSQHIEVNYLQTK